jgi:aminoglycoside phosphotransferase (APT) family kinase protein
MAEKSSAGIDQERVQRWLAEHVEGLETPVEFELIAGGRSNLTYRVVDGAGTRYALRRPPTGGVLSTAHDMSREWRFISALAPLGIPVAPPLAFCDDAEVTGADFYVMGYVEGSVLTDEQAALALTEEARKRAGEHIVEVLVALHELDPERAGLGDLVRRTPFAERQLRRWHAQVQQSGSPDPKLLDEVHDLLSTHIPEQGVGIVHGDYRPGNMSFRPDGTVAAVFDWELSTFGDALADLGYLVSGWQQAGEPDTGVPSPTVAPGFPTREELAARYAELSGRDVSALPFWVAFNRWRMACILAGVQARYLAGNMGDDGYREQAEELSGRISWLAESARDIIRS